MLFLTHISFALLTALISLSFLSPPNKFLFVIFVCFGAVIPDIDHRQSFLSSKVKPLSWFVETFFGRRGFFHSLFPPIILYLVFFHLVDFNVLGFSLILGYLSHIFLDGFNKEGIALFHPLIRKRVSGFIRTGSILEFALLSLILIALFYKVKSAFLF